MVENIPLQVSLQGKNMNSMINANINSKVWKCHEVPVLASLSFENHKTGFGNFGIVRKVIAS